MYDPYAEFTIAGAVVTTALDLRSDYRYFRGRADFLFNLLE
jgi:hypothetical protein